MSPHEKCPLWSESQTRASRLLTSDQLWQRQSRRAEGEGGRRQQQQWKMSCRIQPGCSVAHCCSLLSANLIEWLKVYCVAAEETLKREKLISEVQWSDLCLSGPEWPLFPHSIALPALLFVLFPPTPSSLLSVLWCWCHTRLNILSAAHRRVLIQVPSPDAAVRSLPAVRAPCH